MITFRFIMVGKVREPYYKLAFQEYEKRIARYAKVSVEFINECSLSLKPSQADILHALDIEADRVLDSLGRSDYLFLLDLGGQRISSERLAEILDEICVEGYSHFTFVVGSSYGVSDKLRKAAKYRLSLSDMTFTHPMALEIIIEQVYRALKINHHETYHK
ncbi:MAG: 23S rRNA (pseudouridine(1915)-N(3))-methyltransferase RlmH [Bacilli bacterium]|nr:23S rRNA (pseudouridine(1915)-N(3))-methyltransferase RlmH [Bacilli bacterium]